MWAKEAEPMNRGWLALLDLILILSNEYRGLFNSKISRWLEKVLPSKLRLQFGRSVVVKQESSKIG